MLLILLVFLILLNRVLTEDAFSFVRPPFINRDKRSLIGGVMPLFGRPDIRKLEQDRDTKGLVKALEHRDESLRKEAMEALERMGGEAVEPLINEFRKISPTDPTGILNWTVVKVLGKIGEPAIEPLIAAIREKRTVLSANAALALGLIGEPAVNPLIRMLSDPDQNISGLASVALARIGGPAVEPLVIALTDANDNTRGNAAVALGHAAKQANDRRAIEPLRRALKDANRWVRLHSAGALTRIDPSETQAIQLLKEAAQDYSLDSSDNYRGIAASYLKEISSA